MISVGANTKVGTKLVRSTSLVLFFMMGIGIIWNIYSQTKQARIELLEQGRVLAAQVLAVRRVLAENQHKINYDTQGHFEFKHLNPASVIQQVDRVFNASTRYRIRQVSLHPRLLENKPDSYEREQLLLFARNRDAKESWGETVINGQRFFRYMVPLYVDSSCLQCHGEPQGELDISGRPKEGYKVGDLAGALTISIPMELMKANLNKSILESVFLTVLIVFFTACVITFLTRRFITIPISKLTGFAQELGRGNLTAQPEYYKSYGEIKELTERFTDMAHKLHDIYEQLESKVAERTAELAAANKELAEISQYKTEFLANMSHELRTPLTAILAFTEELLTKSMGQLNAEQEEYLKDIRDSGRQLLNLINDLLDLSKIESGKMALNLTEVNVGEAVRGVEKLLRPLAQQKNIDMQSAITGTNVIIADEEKVRQVIRNLLGNAIKFTPAGGRIELYVRDTDRPDEGVLLTVKDSGPGIPAKDRARIFDSFYQGHRGRNKEYGGTGLGLALVKRIVEMHLGEITLESTEGQGSAFTVYLPAYPPYDDNLE
ncbi:integral membrane sensor signal transduction histidine kinase [Thermincola potens JR]|uniref:Circadian input-output histidine kinase CikA n=1 Tax=Thermincola potens (strain JR) TaxID=635013 RepID=D5XEI8_THEPJ|nr:integral membrane sensor signal transduction histidine kinase [Thermincola potens JR]